MFNLFRAAKPGSDKIGWQRGREIDWAAQEIRKYKNVLNVEGLTPLKTCIYLFIKSTSKKSDS